MDATYSKILQLCGHNMIDGTGINIVPFEYYSYIFQIDLG